MSEINLHHIDCMEFMRGLPDKAYDLAIVDPPYGIHERLMNGGGFMNGNPQRELYMQNQWDKAVPDADYFGELVRVSSNQIIWGGNYFNLPPTRGVVAWVKPKLRNHPNFSQWEMAWTSFSSSAKFVEINPAHVEGRIIHPTQKPVALYRWILQNYAKPGMRILDTHLGSGSIAIACDIEGFDLDGCELDADYIAGARKRLADHRAQPRLFAPEAPPHPTQTSLLQ
jgi:site-specific DNA-methyltransferase (adenine-specific)